MMDFETLVSAVVILVEDKTGTSPALEAVRSVLRETGVEDILRREASVAVPKRLLVRKLQVKGDKKTVPPEPIDYSRSFGSGLNAWVAGNSSGKTSILNSISWALTGVRPRFKPDIAEWLNGVAVEIEIVPDEIFCIVYYLHRTDVRGAIYPCDLAALELGDPITPIRAFDNQTEMRESVNAFFTQELGFAPLEWARLRQLHANGIGWNTYSQALFIDSDNSRDYLYSGVEPNLPQQPTLGAFLGFDLLNALARVEKSYEDARTSYLSEKRRLTANTASSAAIVEAEKRELENLREQLQKLETGQSVTSNPQHDDEVRSTWAEAAARLHQLNKVRDEQQEAVDHLRQELQERNRSCLALKETIAFSVFMNGLSIERCPHCENPISAQQLEHEAESGQCAICGSGLKPVTSVEGHEQLLATQEKTRDNLKKNLKAAEKTLRETNEQARLAEQERNAIDAEYEDLPRQAQTGYDQTWIDLTRRVSYLEGHLAALTQQSEEGQVGKLQGLALRADVLGEAAGHLRRKMVRAHADRIARLVDLTNEYAKCFEIKNFEGVELTDTFEMCVRQSSDDIPFVDMEASERLRLKLAFHFAMVTAQAENGIGRHPGILVLDGLAGAELDDHRFDTVLAGLASMQQRFGEQIQILVASSRTELEQICPEDHLEIKTEQEVLF